MIKFMGGIRGVSMQSHVQLEGGVEGRESSQVDGMEMRFQCESHIEVDWRGLRIGVRGPPLANNVGSEPLAISWTSVWWATTGNRGWATGGLPLRYCGEVLVMFILGGGLRVLFTLRVRTCSSKSTV